MDPEMNWRRTGFALAAAMTLWCCNAFAASFDCGRARSPMEQAICSNAKLSGADAELGEAYRAAVQRIPPEGIAGFRADQRAWLEAVQRACRVPGMDGAETGRHVSRQHGPAGMPKPETLADCLLAPYGERLKVLRHAVARIGDETFVTRTVTLVREDSPADPTTGAKFAGFSVLSAAWPEAQSGDPRWQAWNAAMLEQMQRLGSDSNDNFVPGWREEMANGATDTELTALQPRIEHGRVRVDIAIDSYGHGAAHPNGGLVKFTWLLEAKRALTTGDVFRENSGWQTELAKAAQNDLLQGAQSDDLFDEAKVPGSKSVASVVTDVSNWSITTDGLSLSWPEYSVAPRAFPVDDTVVTWVTLRPYLAAGFAP